MTPFVSYSVIDVLASFVPEMSGVLSDVAPDAVVMKGAAGAASRTCPACCAAISDVIYAKYAGFVYTPLNDPADV